MDSIYPRYIPHVLVLLPALYNSWRQGRWRTSQDFDGFFGPFYPTDKEYSWGEFPSESFFTREFRNALVELLVEVRVVLEPRKFNKLWNFSFFQFSDSSSADHIVGLPYYSAHVIKQPGLLRGYRFNAWPSLKQHRNRWAFFI